MCGRMVLVVGVGFSINMSPLWGYGGLLVHWLIGLMKPIHCAPLERGDQRYWHSIDISLLWSER